MSNPATVILTVLRATGGVVPASVLIDAVGWHVAPSNDSKRNPDLDQGKKPPTIRERLDAEMSYLESLTLCRKVGDGWQGLDRWEKPIPARQKVSSVQVVKPRKKPKPTKPARIEPAPRAPRPARVRKPNPISPETARAMQEALGHLRDGMTRQQAGAAVGRNLTTVRDWMQRSPEYAEQVRQAEVIGLPKRRWLPDHLHFPILERIQRGEGPNRIGREMAIDQTTIRGWIKRVKEREGIS